MTRILRTISLAMVVAALAFAALGARQPPPAQPPPTQPPPTQPPPTEQPPQQPTEVIATIASGDGTAPRVAVPDFIALSRDAETAAIAKTIGQVLWDDLNFEREYALIPRDTYATIPAATSFSDVAFDRWRELNADGVIIGTVQKTATTVHVEVRFFNMKNRQTAFGKEYNGSAANPRLYAHTIADEIHKQQRSLRGVALTRLTFDSDRDGERMGGTVDGA
jgi:Tol biopolymer transport system component